MSKTDKQSKQVREVKTGTLYRTFDVVRDGINENERTVPLAFSSEEPVERWWGVETLDHTPRSIRLDRIKNKGPLLVDHNMRDQVGVLHDVTIGTDRKGRAVARFSKSARAQEIFQDVVDDIRGHVSVGYQIHRMVLEEEKDGKEFYRAVDWEPLEVSLVSIPADITVGIGRSEPDGDHKTLVEISTGDKQEADVRAENSDQPIKEEKEEMNNEKPETREENTVVVGDTRDFEKESKAEKRRVNEILAMADKHDALGMAREYIQGGKSVEDFACALLEKAGSRKVDTSPEIGMTQKESRRFSLVRAIRYLAAEPGERSRLAEDAAFELECSRAAAERNGTDPRGILIPHDVLMRDLTVGVAADGGNLVGTDHLAGSFIDALRNKMLVRRMGARVLDGLIGDVAIPKLSGGATTYWVNPDTTTGPTESKQSFGKVSLTPKTVGALTDMSRKLLKQSSPSVDMLVQDDLSTVLALAIDAAALHGVGSSNQPTGVASTSGIGSVAGGTNGAAPTWANIVGLWQEVAVDNADMGSLGFLTNPKVVGKLMTTDKGTDTGEYVCPSFPNAEGFTSFGGMRAGVSNQVASNLSKGTASAVCSAIFFGNWADLLIGAWGGLDLTVDPYKHSDSGTLRIVALQDVDIAVRHAESFAAMLDALTT